MLNEVFGQYLKQDLKPKPGKSYIRARSIASHINEFCYRHPDKALKIGDYLNWRLQSGAAKSTVYGVEFGYIKTAINSHGQGKAFEIPVINYEPIVRTTVLTQEQMRELCSGDDQDQCRMFCIIALNTGARLDAILSLVRNQIDLVSSNPLIDFRLDHTPLDSERQKGRGTVAMNSYLLAEIRRYMDNQAGNRLFTAFRDNRDFAREFARYVKARGMDGITPHILRHSYASHLAMNGVSLFEISRNLGHKSIKTTERIYAKFLPSYQQASRTVMDGIMNGGSHD